MSSFVKKYAPQNISEVVFPSTRAKTISEKFANGKKLDHIIFHGDYGTGKSTLLKLLSEALFASDENSHVLSLEGFEDGGITNMKRRILNTVESIGITNLPYKIVVIDEFDGCSAKAQMLLKGLIDKAADTDTYFLFATNHLHKIDDGVKSRCVKVNMDNFNPKLWLPRAKQILKNEGIKSVDENQLQKMIAGCNNDTRELMRRLEAIVENANVAA